MGPFICGFLFSIVNTVVLHVPQLVESDDAELWIQRYMGTKG